MKAMRRRAEICEIIRNRSASVEELAGLYDVSLSTIRRDLATLSSRGEVVRTYGGALTPAPGEQGIHEREGLALAQKTAIARAAATHIRDGQFLLFDAGTTVGALARTISRGRRVTVATNGLTSLQVLADSPDVELLVLGGALRHVSQGMIGPLAESALGGMTADMAFLGADGVTADRGVCEGTAEQASLKRLMIVNSAAVFVVADSSKLGLAPSHWWTSLSEPWTLITDDGATEEQLAPFRRHSEVTVEIASRRK
jgi:DeoR/GlpR family transcriptional regulator of sugar metabolism